MEKEERRFVNLWADLGIDRWRAFRAIRDQDQLEINRMALEALWTLRREIRQKQDVDLGGGIGNELR